MGIPLSRMEKKDNNLYTTPYIPTTPFTGKAQLFEFRSANHATPHLPPRLPVHVNVKEKYDRRCTIGNSRCWLFISDPKDLVTFGTMSMFEQEIMMRDLVALQIAPYIEKEWKVMQEGDHCSESNMKRSVFFNAKTNQYNFTLSMTCIQVMNTENYTYHIWADCAGFYDLIDQSFIGPAQQRSLCPAEVNAMLEIKKKDIVSDISYPDIDPFKQMKEKPFKCVHCGVGFAWRHHMTRHERTVHSRLKPFKCTQCDKSFGRKDHMGKHQRTVHSKEKIF